MVWKGCFEMRSIPFGLHLGNLCRWLRRHAVETERDRGRYGITTIRGLVMLKLAIFFLIISLIAGLFGFTGISAASAGIAKILFFIAIALFVLFLIVAVFIGKSVT